MKCLERLLLSCDDDDFEFMFLCCIHYILGDGGHLGAIFIDNRHSLWKITINVSFEISRQKYPFMFFKYLISGELGFNFGKCT